jgi:MFS family permease
MSTRQVIAWALIGIGALALLSRVGPGTGWLWVALAATGFLTAYRREGTYAFLVVGAILAGMAVGLLLEGAWGWRGAFLMSLGLGFLAIDRVEPRASRWPIYPAAVLVGVGLVYWLFRAGILQSFWFPFLLIIAGLYLLNRTHGRWVEVGERSPDGGRPGESEEEATEGEPGPDHDDNRPS